MKFDFPLEIALIDDEQEMVEITSLAINQIDELVPVCFTNPLRALEVIKERKMRLIFTDLMMPGMSGTELIQEAKNFGWNTDIIVMTGLDHLETAYKCFDAGAREILIKPVDIASMIKSVRSIVGRYHNWNRTWDRIY